MIIFRKATWNDRQALLDLIEEGFSSEGDNEGQEHRILFSYLYDQPSWKPDWLYIAEQDGQLLAATGYFPHILSFDNVAIPVGAISPVVTAPKYRNQGLARKCLNNLMENLKLQGVPLVFLWGLPFYYPKLGFVPILPRYKTKITSKELMRVKADSSGRFRECRFQDLTKIAELYQHDNQKYWLQPFRSLEWWQERFAEIDTELAFIKEVPFPKKENFLVWENNVGDPLGYINYSSEYSNYIRNCNDKRVIISEAVATDFACAMAMLNSFSALMKPYQILYIRGTPEHLFNTAAYQLGGTHLNPAPLAGMIKVIDWAFFIELLTPLFHKRLSILSPVHEELHWSWTADDLLIEIIINGNFIKTLITESKVSNGINDSQLLTRLIFGVYRQIELQMDNQSLKYLAELFPPKHPFIWDANYLY